MKKTIIGGFLSLCGAIIDAAVIIAAGIYSASLTSWSGSKFWYAVFGAQRFGSEANLSLNLGFPFVLGAILLGIGIIFFIVDIATDKKNK